MNAREKLNHRLTLVELCQLACAILAFGPPLVLLYRIFALPDAPESGFEGIGLIFGWGAWWPVLLIPLLGFFIAMSRVAVLKRKISELPNEDEQTGTDHAA